MIPCKGHLDWELPDLATRSLDEVRVLRDEIDRRLDSLSPSR
ncbi:MAG: hypothetical protein ABR583_10515 [Gaiellaceae bacterium]